MNTSSNAPRGNQSGEMVQWEHVMKTYLFFPSDVSGSKFAEASVW
jgi:hypothetical protein